MQWRTEHIFTSGINIACSSWRHDCEGVENQLDRDEKSFVYDEENVDHGEKTHPCDEMVGLEMTGDSEHEEASENDGAASVNGSGAG